MKNTINFKDFNIDILLKTAVGAALAIIIAEGFGLMYSPSAGIITLLTIQNTKRETIEITVKRILSFVIAVIIAYTVFNVFGFTSIAFGGFVFIFVATCNILNLKDGISMNAVLTTHFLIEKNMKMPLIINEVYILLIGISIGIFLNMIMINNKKKIKQNQLEVDKMIKDYLIQIGDLLEKKNKGKINFNKIDDFIDISLEAAYKNAKNTLISNTKYHISYLDMRKNQISILKSMVNHIEKVDIIVKQAHPIAYFLRKTSMDYDEHNTVEELLNDINSLKNLYREDELPKTREEFENRAILFQILIEIEIFLNIKRNFINEFNIDIV